MSDEVERVLRQLAPRGASKELRGQVLDAVDRELTASSAPRWGRRCGLAAAAAILLGIVLNVCAVKVGDQRLARLRGPTPVPRPIAELAQTVASVTDAETGERLQQQFMAAWRSHPARSPQRPMDYQQIINGLQFVRREDCRETPQESSEVDRDRGGRIDRDTTDCQRGGHLDHRLTA